MRESTIARNYAETYLELARRQNGDLGQWGTMLEEIAAAMQADATLRLFLESPRVAASGKNAVIAKALDGQSPKTFVRFLQALVTHRRQMLIPEIAREYRDLVDEAEGRVHASVTVVREPGDDERKAIGDRLSKAFGQAVVAHYYVNPAILGGVVVRVGDTVLDGSVRKRLGVLKNRMLAGR